MDKQTVTSIQWNATQRGKGLITDTWNRVDKCQMLSEKRSKTLKKDCIQYVYIHMTLLQRQNYRDRKLICLCQGQEEKAD